MRHECLKLRNANMMIDDKKKIKTPRPKGCAFQITTDEARVTPDVVTGTDIAKITRKRSKPSKHEHGNG
ncbi:hypothetical protein Tco_1523361 [Tanacetum coccineum]